MALPQLSAEQRRVALAKASAVRSARRELQDALKKGKLTLPELFDRADSDEVAGKLKVRAMLGSMPGIGRVKAASFMAEIGIAETRRVRGLGKRQRQELLEAFAPAMSRR